METETLDNRTISRLAFECGFVLHLDNAQDVHQFVAACNAGNLIDFVRAVQDETAQRQCPIKAAAQDLYKALKALESAFQAHTGWSGPPLIEVIAARAAIAKAEGR